MYHTSDFDFELPPDLIASHPLERRDASRMLVVRSSPPLEGCPTGGVVRDVVNYRTLPYNSNLKQRASGLRKSRSLPEALLWKEIKNKQLNGLDFDRQKIIGNYIVDFFCASKFLVIEIDDKTHDFKAEYDKARDEYLKSLNLTVIHISAKEVLENPHAVYEWLSNHPGTSCHPSNGGELGGVVLADKHITDFLDYLQPGDVVVFNNSRVIPARFIVDGHEITLHTAVDDKNWWGLCKKFNKVNVGDILTMPDGTKITVMDKDDESGLLLRFDCDNVFDLLDKYGKMPLPPYMKRDEEIADRERYQTVYAGPLGSMAAPTAGLHFTNELMQKIEERGAKIVKITLHVGAGTWMPVKTENLKEHKMHHEWCCITPEQADIINNANRVIAVGTTSMRTLESAHQLALQKFNKENILTPPLRGSRRTQATALCDAVEGSVHHKIYSQNVKAFSSNMRKNMTDSEKKLWYAINKKRLGFQFRRQYIIDNKYIADFICLEKKLIIEVDGSQHINNKKDTIRTEYLQKFGFNVLRFWNWDIDNDLDGCLQIIGDILTNNSFEKRLECFMKSLKPAPETALAVSTPPQGRGGKSRVAPICQTTDIFITPGYKFGAVDVLLTNFHLPKSTLFMLVSAFAGLDEMKSAYKHAVDEKYRFFSYGDCCLLFKKEMENADVI